jgi:hypothetical protein
MQMDVPLDGELRRSKKQSALLGEDQVHPIG